MSLWRKLVRTRRGLRVGVVLAILGYWDNLVSILLILARYHLILIAYSGTSLSDFGDPPELVSVVPFILTRNKLYEVE